MSTVAEIFESYAVSNAEVAYGVLLGAAVTAMLGVQAFYYHDTAYETAADLRLVVFVVHVACLGFVLGDALRFNGIKAIWAHLTIGTGIFATLGQIAVVAAAKEYEEEAFALATLGVQSLADALMLAFIIADLRASRGYKILQTLQ